MGKPAKEAVEATELLFELFLDHKRNSMSLAREHGLTPQQWATLWSLAPGQRLAMSALADILGCDASNVTGIVDKLESRGLAQREQGEDRRVKVLTLTEEGERLRVEIRERSLQPAPWMLSLSRDDQRELREILKRAVDALRVANAE